MPLLIVVGIALPESARRLVFGTGATASIIIGALAMHPHVNLYFAEVREAKAGYTTTYGYRMDLWQLDPKTGEVLRAPGETKVRCRVGPPTGDT